MKYLLVFAVLMLGFWLWGSRRRIERKDDAKASKQDKSSPGGPQLPQAMVRCAVCGVHLPEVDAIKGKAAAKGAVYCSVAHFHQAEG